MSQKKVSLVCVVFIFSVLGFFFLHQTPKPFLKNAYYYYINDRQNSCFSTYDRFYKEDEVSILISFGYKDTRPFRYVGDRYEKEILLGRLLSECEGNYHACGFQRSSQDMNLFFKTILGPRGKSIKINLRVLASSVSPDDDFNRTDSYQKWNSAYVERSFLDSFHSHEAVLYYGHSRDGGGPDFKRPRLKKNKHINYTYYKKKKPGLKKLVSALKKASSPPELLGMYSCVATQHFSRPIRKVYAQGGLLTSSQLLYVTDALESLYQTLESLLSMKCEGDFRRSVLENHPPESTQLKGFFSS